jgi:hypothetical protein
MTRIDMTASELRALIAPVIPHASTDADEPHLSVIRIECAEKRVYAIATDRYTLAAERHRLPETLRLWGIPAPVHVDLLSAKTALALFKPTKDWDPVLKITIDKAAVPVDVAGERRTVDHLALTIEAPDGTRVAFHDKRDPSQDPLGGWRKTLAGMWARKQAKTAPALSLSAMHLPKWGGAVRKGERLVMLTGEKEGSPVLVLVEDHFAGVWMQVSYLHTPQQMLAESPWRDELHDLAAALAESLAAMGDTATRNGEPLTAEDAP